MQWYRKQVTTRGPIFHFFPIRLEVNPNCNLSFTKFLCIQSTKRICLINDNHYLKKNQTNNNKISITYKKCMLKKTKKTCTLTQTTSGIIRSDPDWDVGSPTSIHLSCKWPSLVLLLSQSKVNQCGQLSSQSREPGKHLALHSYLIRGRCRPC